MLTCSKQGLGWASAFLGVTCCVHTGRFELRGIQIVNAFVALMAAMGTTVAAFVKERELIAISGQVQRVKLIRSAILGVVSGFNAAIAVGVFLAWERGTIAREGVHLSQAVGMWLWIVCQAICLAVPVLSVLVVFEAVNSKRKLKRLIEIVGNLVILAIPVVLLLDGLVFNWIGHRLFSNSVARGVASLPRLVPFMNYGAVVLLVGVGAFCILTTVIVWCVSSWLARCIDGWGRRRIGVAVFAVYLFVICFAVSKVVTADASLAQAMQSHSSEHPFFVFGLLNTPSVGPEVDWRQGQIARVASLVEESDLDAGDRGSSSLLARQRRIRMVQVSPPQQPQSMPDVVVVIIESLRPEIVVTDVMPNLSQLAKEGTHCKSHFSGGNATNHGFFSIVTGLEPIWFGSPVGYDPGLYRCFKSLGYETGFFAGANDWDDFRMDAFTRPESFDVHDVVPRDGIASDRHAVTMAKMFLTRQTSDSAGAGKRIPRLAIVYLYGTHATYQSYSNDQIDQPAADNRFPFPYPRRMRDAVWNRYRNSARTIDRLLKPLLERDRVIAIVGDHGEAFFEDGTVGHGLRLSRYQNMTAGIFYCPDWDPKVIEQPTSHIDILPTLLSFVGVQLSDAAALDGHPLVGTVEQILQSRRFCVRNYLGNEYGLIGPWTRDAEKPFAYRFNATLRPHNAMALNGIDERGYETDLESLQEMSSEVKKWQLGLYRGVAEISNER